MPHDPGGDLSSAPAPRAATIYDVAALAGVSHQTVSRLLKGGSGIRAGNREKVERALIALDYRPNRAARLLATMRSNRIAVLTHESAQFGPATILAGAVAAAREHGYLLDVISLDTGHPEQIAAALGAIDADDIAGVIALGATEEMVTAFTRTPFRVPVVLDQEYDTGGSTATQRWEDVGIREVLSHMRSQGHRSCLHISGPVSWTATHNRRSAYLAAVRALRLRSVAVIAGDWSAASGHAAIRSVPVDDLPTLVFAANDQMAIGALLALHERGLSVPEDVSVIGVDDIPEAAFLKPPLTTFRVDFQRHGADILETLLGRIRGESTSLAAPVAELVLRASTGPAPARADRRYAGKPPRTRTVGS